MTSGRNEMDPAVSVPGGLVVLSGPSGVGKTSICKRLAEDERVVLSVSATTRPPRPGEVHGREYFFLSREAFEEKIRRGAFVEYNEVFGNGVLYGSLKEEVEKGLAEPGRYYLMEIDVRGAQNVRAAGYAGRYIFIEPPSLDELLRRLAGRGTDDPASIEERLKKARWEMDQRKYYDLVVVNDDLDQAVERIRRYLCLA